MRPESAIFRSSDRRSATIRTMAEDRIALGQALLVAVSVLAAEHDEQDSRLESHHFPPDELAMQLDDAVVHRVWDGLFDDTSDVVTGLRHLNEHFETLRGQDDTDRWSHEALRGDSIRRGKKPGAWLGPFSPSSRGWRGAHNDGAPVRLSPFSTSKHQRGIRRSRPPQ